VEKFFLQTDIQYLSELMGKNDVQNALIYKQILVRDAAVRKVSHFSPTCAIGHDKARL
jgi:hypothetical protein